MMSELPKTAGSVALWVLGVLAFSTVARVGWEIGGVLWGAF